MFGVLYLRVGEEGDWIVEFGWRLWFNFFGILWWVGVGVFDVFCMIFY